MNKNKSFLSSMFVLSCLNFAINCMESDVKREEEQVGLSKLFSCEISDQLFQHILYTQLPNWLKNQQSISNLADKANLLSNCQDDELKQEIILELEDAAKTLNNFLKDFKSLFAVNKEFNKAAGNQVKAYFIDKIKSLDQNLKNELLEICRVNSLGFAQALLLKAGAKLEFSNLPNEIIYSIIYQGLRQCNKVMNYDNSVFEKLKLAKPNLKDNKLDTIKALVDNLDFANFFTAAEKITNATAIVLNKFILDYKSLCLTNKHIHNIFKSFIRTYIQELNPKIKKRLMDIADKHNLIALKEVMFTTKSSQLPAEVIFEIFDNLFPKDSDGATGDLAKLTAYTDKIYNLYLSISKLSTNSKLFYILNYYFTKKIKSLNTYFKDLLIHMSLFYKTDINVDAFKFFIKAGASVDADYFYVPLIVEAAQKNNLEAVKLLLEHGANPNVSGFGNVRDLPTIPITPLINAIINENAEIVQLLLDVGANVNFVPERLCILPLTHAVRYNKNTEILEKLIKAGISVDIARANLEDHSSNYSILNLADVKETPLHIASRLGKIRFVKVLLPKMQNINAKDSKGNTALHLAACLSVTNNYSLVNKNKLEIVQELISAGADISLVNNKNQTALHYVLDQDNYEPFVVPEEVINMFKLLLNNKVDVNAVDINGNTALHYAVKLNRPDIVQLLLSYNADKNILNKIGQTAFMIAKDMQNRELMNLLEPIYIGMPDLIPDSPDYWN